MHFKLTKDFPSFTTDECRMFAHPTRTADLYSPAVETILRPGFEYSATSIEVEVFTGATESFTPQSRKGLLKQKLTTKDREETEIDLKDEFVIDARFDADGNISHVINNLISPIIIAKKMVESQIGKSIKPIILLRKNATNMSQRAFEIMGFEVITTNLSAKGNVIQICNPGDHAYFASIPEVFSCDFPGYVKDTPRRVFIPRRGARSISNNEEISKYMESKGFTTLYFEDLTLEEEWSIARNAEAIAAVYGAAWSHIVFNRVGLREGSSPRSGVKILDILSPNFCLNTTESYAKILNGTRVAVRGQITPETIRELDFKDRTYSPHQSPMSDSFKVSKETLSMALNELGI